MNQINLTWRLLEVIVRANETKHATTTLKNTETKIGGPERIAGTSAALDPVLWFYGKYGCSYCEKAGKRVPIGSACGHCQLFYSHVP